MRGIGCGVVIASTGGLAPKDEVAIRFGRDADISIFSSTGPSGQGHETVFPQIMADALGFDAAKITLRAGSHDGPVLAGTGTFSSRSTLAHGSAVFNAAQDIIRRGMDLAADELEAAIEDLEFTLGQYRVKGTDRAVSLEALARNHEREGDHPLDARGEQRLARAFPSGAHIVEVEIDPETGEITLVRYVAADDCGTVMNHTILEGQIHGGILQGLGQVFGENCIYENGSGQLLSGSFMDYTMPRADLLGVLQLHDLPVPSPNNPLGVKGAGEAGTTGAVPAAMNAIVDALKPLAIRHFDMPVTPGRLWQAIRRATGSGA